MTEIQVKDLEKYVAARLVDLEAKITAAAADPHDKFGIRHAIEEVQRLSAWVEVKSSEDSFADRGGRDL